MTAKKRDLEEKENIEPVVNKKRPLFLTLMIILAGTVVGVGLVMGAVLYFVGIPGVVPRLKAPPPPVYETMELGERVVNLADVGGGRYLRLRIVLEYQKNEKLTAEIKEKTPQIMDRILYTLRGKSVDDVRPADKEEKVKSEIIGVINEKLKNGKVEKIYFTDFLIQ